MNVVVTRTGFFSRLKNSVAGILFGILAVLGAMALLGWNEYRTVRERKGLEQGRAIVVTASADRVDPQLQGKLVYLTGKADSAAGTTDAELGLHRAALVLMREVEMYQWKERKSTKTEKNVGGGETTTTTYSYEKVWSDDVINSDSFHDTSHRNPGRMPITSDRSYADDAKLGAYTLNRRQLGQIGGARDIPPSEVRRGARVSDWSERGEFLYQARNPGQPEIGDLRLKFKEVLATDISVVAAQAEAGLDVFETSNGTEIELLERGVQSVDAMFQHAQDANSTLGWILRVLGFVVMWIGFGMTVQPLRVLADVIPPLGRVVGSIGGMLTFVLAAVLSLLTITIAWLFSRPLMVISVMAIVIGMAVLIGQVRASRRPTAPVGAAPPFASPPPPPPPPPRF